MALFKDEAPILSANTAIDEGVGIETNAGSKLMGSWNEVVSIPAAGSHVNQYVYWAPYPVEVVAFSVIYVTASSSGTLMLEHETPAQAVGSGTNVLTGTVSTSSTAATLNKGTLASAPGTLQLAAKDTLGLVSAGTATSFAGGLVNITLKRI